MLDNLKAILGKLGVAANGEKDIIEKAKEHTKCTTESCVLTHPMVMREVGKNAVRRELMTNFKPAGPALDPHELLNNHHIDNVLDQLTKAYPGFYHIPFQMIDFAEMARTDAAIMAGNSKARDSNLATIDIIEKYKKGYNCFGVVLNTDYSHGPGVHWFSLFIDARDKSHITIEYFNSSGNMALVQVISWMASARVMLSELGHVDVVRVVEERLQEDDYSCGVWALYYILSRCAGVPSTVFNNQSSGLDDNLMYELRKHFFRHYSI